MRLALIILIVGAYFNFSLASSLAGDPPPRDVRVWTPRAPFTPWASHVGDCAQHGDGGEWSVSIEQGIVVADPVEYEPLEPLEFPFDGISPAGCMQLESGLQSLYETRDGYLAAFNRGEFGGSVWALNSEGSPVYRILEGNPIGFGQLGNDVLVVSGIVHGAPPGRGSIYHLTQNAISARWEISGTVNLDSAPWQFLDENGTLFIITMDGLVRYEDHNAEYLLRSKFGYLVPNSMVRDSEGTFFVGMRYLVVELKKSETGYSERWLASPSCPDFDAYLAGRHACKCVGSLNGRERR